MLVALALAPARAPASDGCNRVFVSEWWLRVLIRGLFQSGLVSAGSLIDAGANTGQEACLLAHLASQQRVHAIEPLSINVEHMRAAYGDSKPNLRPMVGALSDSARSMIYRAREKRHRG
eukprot:3635702-Prymnesium_polylepis.1